MVQGVLSASEAKAIVAAAERVGFEHQGSRGPAHGEVLPSLVLLPSGITAHGLDRAHSACDSEHLLCRLCGTMAA